MATGIMIGLPRPSTSKGLPKMNLPVIKHPSSRLGDKSRLSIRGESRQQIYRNNTFVSLDDGKLQLGLDRKNLPPLNKTVSEHQQEGFVGRSQPAEESFDFYSFHSQTRK